MLKFSKMKMAIRMRLVFGLTLFISLGGCHDECDVGDSKCENNQIFVCAGSDNHRDTWWKEFRNCDDFNAVCTPHVLTRYTDFGASTQEWYVDRTQHSCVTEDFVCEGNSGQQCIDSLDYIVNCAWHNEDLVAAVGAENWDNRPFCVYVKDDAVFAYAEGSCTNYDKICDDSGRTLMCKQGTWQWVSDYCVSE